MAANDAAAGANQVIDVALIRKALFAKRLPQSEKWRQYWGRATDMSRIEDAIQSANVGVMVDLCDLESESIAMDPHVLSVAGKRFGALAAKDWSLTPAEGPGINKVHAIEVADTVRSHLRRMLGFKQAINDIAWSLFDGRGAMEIDWQYVRGARDAWRPAGLGWIHPRRLGFGPDRELRVVDSATRIGFYEPAGVALRDIPGKFLWWMPRLFREYPEREGLGPRTLYWSFFKRFSARMRMILTELFALPWRIIEADKDAPVQKEDIDTATDAAEALGQTTTAAFAPGLKLRVEPPAPESGALFNMTIEDVDRQMSKLYLGNEGTTEAGGAGLGSNMPAVHKGEQNIFLERDGDSLGERIQVQLVDQDVVLNFGLADLAYSPRFKILTAPDKDRQAEQTRRNGAITIGVPVSLSEYYEETGIKAPEQDEAVIVLVDGPPGPLGQAGPPRAKIVDPSASAAPDEPLDESAAPEASLGAAGSQPSPGPGGDITLSPGDMAAIVTVNEVRNAKGWGPLRLPNGAEDPDGYLSVAAFKAKHASVIATAAAASAGDTGPSSPPTPGAPPGPGSPPPPPGKPSPEASNGKAPPVAESSSPTHPAAKAIKEALANSQVRLAVENPEVPVVDQDPAAGKGDGFETCTDCLNSFAALGYTQEQAKDMCADKCAPVTTLHTTASRELKRQPGFVNGSPETIIEKGAKDGAKLTAAFAAAFEDAVGDASEGRAVYSRLKRAANSISVEKLAGLLERKIVHSLMLGALDAAWEAEADQPIAIPIFSERGGILLAGYGKGIADFVTKPFAEAIKDFTSKQVMTRRAFDRLRGEAKRRAFTVAGLTKTRMLETAHDELTKAIAEGSDLRDFRSKLAKRFESAGWTPLNSSHVEVVFRNATMSSYASGRDEQMSQPEVLAVRPYWQCMGVRDDRQRENHKLAMGKVLRFDDGFWKRAPLPWGHNCRCRKVSRSEADLKRLGLAVTSGADLVGLPDEGWDASAILG